MGMFEGMLKDTESLFLNDVALDPEFMPKQISFRENEHQVIALRIRPLFQKRTGSNLLISGSPGIGKTVAVRKVLEELEETTEEITPLYVNCWQHNSTYKVVLELCKELGYVRTVNKNTTELLDTVLALLNKSSCVFVFDELDRSLDLDYLYVLSEKVYRKTIIVISNYTDTLADVDERIRSRLSPELLEFRPYTLDETRAILEQRKNYAFVAGVWQHDAFEKIVETCFAVKDIRKGLYLLREAGNCAESEASRKITVQHAEKAVAKLAQTPGKRESLDDDGKRIISLVSDDEKIGALFQRYQEGGGASSYKTFQRKIEKFAHDGHIFTRKVTGGPEGTTTIVSKKEMKLTDFG